MVQYHKIWIHYHLVVHVSFAILISIQIHLYKLIYNHFCNKYSYHINNLLIFVFFVDVIILIKLIELDRLPLINLLNNLEILIKCLFISLKIQNYVKDILILINLIIFKPEKYLKIL
jgi:hypothetical protein